MSPYSSAAKGASLEPVLPLERRQRAAGGRVDLERAQDAHPVVRVQPGGRRGIDLSQARVQRRDPGRLRLGRQPPPHLRVDRRRVEQAAQQRLEVEPGAAHDDRHRSRGVQRADQRPREPGEVRGIEGLVRGHDVDQVVRHRRPLGRGRLGRADVHAPVDLHRVGADHLPVQGAGHRDPDPGLADGRRPADHDEPGARVRAPRCSKSLSVSNAISDSRFHGVHGGVHRVRGVHDDE